MYTKWNKHLQSLALFQAVREKCNWKRKRSIFGTRTYAANFALSFTVKRDWIQALLWLKQDINWWIRYNFYLISGAVLENEIRKERAVVFKSSWNFRNGFVLNSSVSNFNKSKIAKIRGEHKGLPWIISQKIQVTISSSKQCRYGDNDRGFRVTVDYEK